MLLTVPPLFDWRRADLRWRAGCSSVYEQCTAGGCGRAWQVRELGARRQQQHLDAAGWPALSPWGGDRAADWSWRAAVSGRRRRRIQSGDQGTTNTTTTTTTTTTTNTNTNTNTNNTINHQHHQPPHNKHPPTFNNTTTANQDLQL